MYPLPKKQVFFPVVWKKLRESLRKQKRVKRFCFRVDSSSIFEKPAENAPVLVLFRGIDIEMVMVMKILIIKRKSFKSNIVFD